MKFCTEPTLIEQFGYYAQKATSQKAFLSAETLIDRFRKKQKRLIGTRQKSRYRTGIKKIASTFGLVCFLAPGKRGHTLNITSSENSHFNPYYEKIAALAQPLLKKLHNSKEPSINVYEILRKTVKDNSDATLGRIVREFKAKAKTLGLEFFKIGRNLHVRLRYPNTPKIRNKNNHKKCGQIDQNTAQNPDIFYYKKTKDEELLRNTASAEVRFSESMVKKAWWLARELGSSKNFWDNCKVKKSMGMLVNFARWAIQEGFEDTVIEIMFNRALVQRHKDATDMGNNMQQPSFMFELSSTVSLAKTYLLSDRKTLHKRWSDLKTRIFSQRKAQEPKQKPQKYCKKISSEEIVEDTMPQLSNEEEMEIYFLEAGFSKRQISLFRHYKNKTMSSEYLQIHKRLIENMLSFFNSRPKLPTNANTLLENFRLTSGSTENQLNQFKFIPIDKYNRTPPLSDGGKERKNENQKRAAFFLDFWKKEFTELCQSVLTFKERSNWIDPLLQHMPTISVFAEMWIIDNYFDCLNNKKEVYYDKKAKNGVR